MFFIPGTVKNTEGFSNYKTPSFGSVPFMFMDPKWLMIKHGNNKNKEIAALHK